MSKLSVEEMEYMKQRIVDGLGVPWEMLVSQPERVGTIPMEHVEHVDYPDVLSEPHWDVLSEPHWDRPKNKGIFKAEYMCQPSPPPPTCPTCGSEVDPKRVSAVGMCPKCRQTARFYNGGAIVEPDIVIGSEFWFLAGQFDGDPTVAHGKVVEYEIWHSEVLVKPRCKLVMRLKNGRTTECYDTDLYPTRKSAEKARMLQLEEEQDDRRAV